MKHFQKDQLREAIASTVIVVLLFGAGYLFGAAVGNTTVVVLR